MDDRLRSASFTRHALNKVFPDHWSFMLGEVALYSFVVLLLTGVFLTFFFDPSVAHTTYEGSYEPMKGVQMSERSEEHTSELQSRQYLVCRLLLEKKHADTL